MKWWFWHVQLKEAYLWYHTGFFPDNIEIYFRIHLEIVVFVALLPTPVLFELPSVLVIHTSFTSPFFSLKQTWPTCSHCS